MLAIAFDTETTGLEPGSRAIELAAQKFDASTGEVVDTFCQLINPEMPVPPDVLAVNKINPDDLVHEPFALNALDAFRGFIHGAEFLVAHHSPFDVGVVSWDMARCGLPLPTIPVVDTCAMAKAIKQTVNNKLATLVATYQIPLLGEAHRALVDADACRKYFLKARTVIPAPNTTWAPDYTYVQPDELPETLRDLPACVESGRGFSFEYVDKDGNNTSRTIIPYGWAMQRDEVMFHGLCQLRGERRTFKASGVTQAAVKP